MVQERYGFGRVLEEYWKGVVMVKKRKMDDVLLPSSMMRIASFKCVTSSPSEFDLVQFRTVSNLDSGGLMLMHAVGLRFFPGQIEGNTASG